MALRSQASFITHLQGCIPADLSSFILLSMHSAPAVMASSQSWKGTHPVSTGLLQSLCPHIRGYCVHFHLENPSPHLAFTLSTSSAAKGVLPTPNEDTWPCWPPGTLHFWAAIAIEATKLLILSCLVHCLPPQLDRQCLSPPCSLLTPRPTQCPAVMVDISATH